MVNSSVPAYGGFASFRPYNYRHVFAQTQLAQQWGHAHGMPYSQQFWNRYRTSYMDGNLHFQQPADYAESTDACASISDVSCQGLPPSTAVPVQGHPNNAYPVSAVRPIGYQMQDVSEQPVAEGQSVEATSQAFPAELPIHVLRNA